MKPAAINSVSLSKTIGGFAESLSRISSRLNDVKEETISFRSIDTSSEIGIVLTTRSRLEERSSETRNSDGDGDGNSVGGDSFFADPGGRPRGRFFDVTTFLTNKTCISVKTKYAIKQENNKKKPMRKQTHISHLIHFFSL
jgi:hypothetical protein